MASHSRSADAQPSFVLALGDNFYTKGVQSTSDYSWEYLWENVYLQFDVLRIPWYTCY